MTGKCILSVDDDAINQEIIEGIIDDRYALIKAYDGAECLEKISEGKPDLILLDVNMPRMNGLEVCKKLRYDGEDIPVIFVSALTSPEERLAGYKVGADDYITKPFNHDELLTKIDLLLTNHQIKKELSVSSQQATQITMTAMSGAAEIGNILRIIQETFYSEDVITLGKNILKGLDNYGLPGCLMLQLGEKITFIFSDGIERPLEKDILQQVQHTERIISFGRRSIYNGIYSSLLIRLMPEDEEVCGRWRDNLAILIDSVDARLKSLAIEKKRDYYQLALQDTLFKVQNNLQLIHENYIEQRLKNVDIIRNLILDMEESFAILGLSEEQEKQILEKLLMTEKEVDHLYDLGMSVEEKLNEVVTSLKAVVD